MSVRAMSLACALVALPFAALRQSVVFLVDKDFVPKKLIVECASCSANEGFRPVRFTLPAR